MPVGVRYQLGEEGKIMAKGDRDRQRDEDNRSRVVRKSGQETRKHNLEKVEAEENKDKPADPKVQREGRPYKSS